MILLQDQREASLQGVSDLRRAARRRLSELRLPVSCIDAVQLVVSEIATNAVVHAAEPPSRLSLSITLDGVTAVVEVSDDGSPFRGAERAAMAATGPALHPGDSLAESGRGLGLVQSHVTSASYEAGPPNVWRGRIALQKRRRTILLVEDSDALRATYASVLAQRFEVMAAASLDEAIVLARTTPPDAIVADLHLGPERGTSLCLVLDADEARPPVPMIVLTADRSAAAHAGAMRLGVDRVLTKPIAPAQLLAAVDGLVTKSTRQALRLARHYRTEIEAARRFETVGTETGYRTEVCSGTSTLGGGDFVIALPLACGARIVAADVMGHGLGAQAASISYMAMLRTCHALVGDGGPGAFLSAVSRTLATDPVQPDTIITLLVADLGLDGVTIASAGHPHALALSQGALKVLEAGGPLPGLFADHAYGDVSVQLAPGERLVLTSDGVDPQGSMVGGACPPWLAAQLVGSAERPIGEAIRDLSSVAARILGEPPTDDWTILMLESACSVVEGVRP
jgi:CheY-like chemotaxis protein/anti-sigma regulatory factor (Ser/Thr protein kinase)